MAFVPYHNIVGATLVDNVLLAVGDLARLSIKNINIANIHATASATIDIYIYKDSTDTTDDETYYIIKKVRIPVSATLMLDNSDLLKFDNSATGYSLNIRCSASDVLDVMIKV